MESSLYLSAERLVLIGALDTRGGGAVDGRNTSKQRFAAEGASARSHASSMRLGREERPVCDYSAAMRVAGSTGSTLAAQYLNSGIFPNGSSAGLVSRLAAAST